MPGLPEATFSDVLGLGSEPLGRLETNCGARIQSCRVQPLRPSPQMQVSPRFACRYGVAPCADPRCRHGHQQHQRLLPWRERPRDLSTSAIMPAATAEVAQATLERVAKCGRSRQLPMTHPPSRCALRWTRLSGITWASPVTAQGVGGRRRHQPRTSAASEHESRAGIEGPPRAAFAASTCALRAPADKSPHGAQGDCVRGSGDEVPENKRAMGDIETD